VTACGYCGAPVRWAVVEASGKRMPLDPDPRSDGNVVIVRHDRQQTPTVRVLRKGEAPPALAYRPHMATCPRRPKR